LKAYKTGCKGDSEKPISIFPWRSFLLILAVGTRPNQRLGVGE
jgi:hypothetical protein